MHAVAASSSSSSPALATGISSTIDSAASAQTESDTCGSEECSVAEDEDAAGGSEDRLDAAEPESEEAVGDEGDADGAAEIAAEVAATTAPCD